MSPAEIAVIALVGTVGWLALVVVTMHFRLAQARLCDTLDRVTDNLVGLKNPWAAQAVQEARASQLAAENGGWPARERLPMEVEEGI